MTKIASAKRQKMTWREREEEDAQQSGTGVSCDLDDVWSGDEERLRKQG